MNHNIQTAIFPVAGMGTRFLPITKAIPKEMLPIINKPLIQFAVEEALEAGIKKFIFVTHANKRAIEDYFDSNYELESRLQDAGKLEYLQQVRDILPNDVCFSYVRQKAPRGLGDAVLSAKALVGDEAFAVLLADDLMQGKGHAVLKQMVEQHQQHGSNVLAIEEVSPEQTDKYGIVEFNQHSQVQTIVEKPKPVDAPSNFAVVGRYILTPDIFQHLEQIPYGVGGELQLTDAIAAQIKANQAVYAHAYQGQRFDCGSVAGYLKAMLAYAKQDPELSKLL